LTEPDGKSKLSLFMGFAAELYGLGGGNLLENPTIKEFLLLQDLVVGPLLIHSPPHTKYLGCQSCFPNRKLYFQSLEEMSTHVTGIGTVLVFLSTV
jgi:hypothetical protein